MLSAEHQAKLRAGREARRAAGNDSAYPWAKPGECHTCSGAGILTARFGGGWRWCICPPCRGRGRDRASSTAWDAGAPQTWLPAATEEELRGFAAAVRAEAPPVGSGSEAAAKETAVDRRLRAERVTMPAEISPSRSGADSHLRPSRSARPKG